MPSRKLPKSLYDTSFSVLVNHIINEWIIVVQNTGQDIRPDVQKFIPIFLPSEIADTFFKESLLTYVKMLKNDIEGKLPDISHFIDFVMLTNLTVLDLSVLVSLGFMHNEYFENVLASKLLFLNNLGKISLRTHVTDVTLPVCTEHMLELIGKNCQKLISLDISNHGSVTDAALRHLIPCSENPGCPLLEEIFVYECSVSLDGAAQIINAFPNLRLLGYKETALAILHLIKQLRNNNEKLENCLKLTHINNLGNITSTSGPDTYDLCFTKKMACAINAMCPRLNNLKVRLTDHNLASFRLFPSLSSLELVYYVGKPSSPGKGTMQFLKLHGTQLRSLAITCAEFAESQITLLGGNCPNLKHLWLRCNSLLLSDIGLEYQSSKDMFSILETLYLRIGESERSVCALPLRVVQSILCNTDKLEELKLVVRSDWITDWWLRDLFLSVNTMMLKRLLIALPYKNYSEGAINLTMCSVHMILDRAPDLHSLGNLLVWNVSPEEVRGIHSDLELCNFDFNITYDFIKVR